jgi:mannitol-specific phosphotransferase system IIBC component
MKTLATVVLSLIAIAASLVLLLSTVCAFTGGVVSGGDRSSFVICAVVSLAVVIAAMSAINHLNRKRTPE